MPTAAARTNAPASSHGVVEESVEYLRSVVQSKGWNDDVVAVLIRESADLLKEREPRGGGLSEDQARFLIESGDFTAEELAETERQVAAGELASEERQTRLGALARTLSAAEVADRLDIDPSRVRHRQGKGLLYSFLVGGKRRYPTWQFVTGTKMVLPHLASVVEAFPEDWHPAGVEAFMTAPKSSLVSGVSSERLSPVEWLMNGGDPQDVVDILDSFLQS